MIYSLLAMIFCLAHTSLYASSPTEIAILAYHNFNPTVPGSMTISPQQFEQQLKWLKTNGYQVIRLQTAVDYLQGKRITLSSKSVVITADDGKKSVYTYMFPLIQKYQVPVTLFIYPTPISHAAYALTWDEIKAMEKTGLVDIQSHTYWHPNFNQEKKRLSTKAYEQLVRVQLVNAKILLEKQLNKKITLLAWPYGIYNPYLEQQAAKAGFIMAFSIDDRKASRKENNMAQPRYMVSAKYGMKWFAKMVRE